MVMKGITFAVVSATAILGGITTANAMSAEECANLWKQASPSGEPMSESQSAGFLDNFQQLDANGNAKIDLEEFNAACAKDQVHAKK